MPAKPDTTLFVKHIKYNEIVYLLTLYNSGLKHHKRRKNSSTKFVDVLVKQISLQFDEILSDLKMDRLCRFLSYKIKKPFKKPHCSL